MGVFINKAELSFSLTRCLHGLLFPCPPLTLSLFVPLLFRSSLGEYYKDSRNLKRVKDSSEYLSLSKLRLSGFETSPHVFPLEILTSLAIRFRLLKHTRLNVVAFLNELPKTQHDIASFTIDVNTYTVGFHSVIHLDVFL